MDYLYEYSRMCAAMDGCGQCEIWALEGGFIGPGLCQKRLAKHADEARAIIERWAEAHPEITYREHFLRHYPMARVRSDGTPYVCVENVFGDGLIQEDKCTHGTCPTCWNRTYKEGQT